MADEEPENLTVKLLCDMRADILKGFQRSALPQLRGCRGAQFIKPLPADLAIGVLSA